MCKAPFGLLQAAKKMAYAVKKEEELPLASLMRREETAHQAYH
jgi:hypothetical protein